MLKNLKKRVFTSFILATIVLNCLFINNYSWLFLLSIVSLICWFEFINLTKKIWKNALSVILLNLLSFSYLSLFLYSAYKIKVESGEIIILFVLLVCIFSDIGGYVIGKIIGGKKLTKISPKKTISGAFGSFLFSLFPIGIYIIVTNLTDNNLFMFPKDNEVIPTCLLLSFTCQLGDLFISYFKRLAKVKNTGNILPGHGGMLDRIDGIIFAVPVSLIVNYLT